MPAIRPLAAALAVSVSLFAFAATADAATRKKAAKSAPASTSAAACTDFYTDANAAWLKANPVPASGAVTALGQLADLAVQQQRTLLDNARSAPQNTVQKLLGDFWASGLDEAAVEADGARPIAPLLDRINAIRKGKDVPAAIAALHQVGIPVAFNFGPDIDLKALDRHIGYFMQGGMGLPDPAYYTRDDAGTRELLGRYRAYVQQILALTGTPKDRLESESAAVLDIETRIARSGQTLGDLGNPFNNYAPVAVKDLGKQYRNLQLDAFLKAQGVNDDLVSLADPRVFQTLDGMIGSVKPEAWKAYLRWRVGDAMAPYLSASFRDAGFGFRGRLLQGQQEPSPRWQQVLDAINTAAGPMLGRQYADRYLSAEARKRAGEIADNVRKAQIAAVQRSSWLSDAAKAEAGAKLEKLKIEIGSPHRDLDYSVQPMGRGSFGGNMLIASTWRHREEMKRIGKGNADRRWDVLPQQPALTYDIAQNRLIVTAAVLQAPVLDLSRPLAAQYGAFGALVGHQINGAINDKGRLINAQGSLGDWWGAADKNAWAVLAGKLAGQYDGRAWPQLSGTKVNGKLTSAENMGDLAGIETAWDAFSQAQPNADVAARKGFFTGWAQLWAQQISPSEAAQRAVADLRAPGQWRVDGPLANLPAFGAAYACKAGQPMQLPDAQQVRIWR